MTSACLRLKSLRPQAELERIIREFEAQGWEAARLADHEMATLFRPRVVRKLARAEIRLFNNLYFARELEEFHGLMAHIAYDIHRPEKVWVYTPEGRLICEAQCNGNSRHYFPVAVVEQARQDRAKGRLKRVEAKREEILEELHGAPALAAPSSSLLPACSTAAPVASPALASASAVASPALVAPSSILLPAFSAAFSVWEMAESSFWPAVLLSSDLPQAAKPKAKAVMART